MGMMRFVKVNHEHTITMADTRLLHRASQARVYAYVWSDVILIWMTIVSHDDSNT